MAGKRKVAPSRARPRRRERPSGDLGASLRKEGGEVTVALAYPNVYRVAMANLGFQIVFRQLSRIPGVLPLRVFLPEGEDGRRGTLLTHDHPREVSRSDWLAFSVSYENDYLNVLGMLASAGVPLDWKDRPDPWPLVIVGGIAPSLNPEPLADFADIFVIGEAEEILPRLHENYVEARRAGAAREDLLLGMTRLPGVYVPRFYRPAYTDEGTLASFEALRGAPARVRKLWVEDLEAFRPDSVIQSPDAEFRDMILVEVGRGCGRGCRFCAAGFFYRPVRYRRYESLVRVMAERMEPGSRFGLLGASVFDHPDLERLAGFLAEHGCPFSVSSFRADAVSAEVLARMAAGGIRTATIAPETGTERLRAIAGKDITDEAIFEAARMITAAGIPNLKLYFMVGLPHELREDIEGIIDLVKKVRHNVLSVARGKGAMGGITVSLSCFVPKAWTPFQWEPMEDIESLRDKQRYLALSLNRIPNVKATHDLPRWSFVQGLLSRGDRRVGRALLLAHDLQGNWKKALQQSPVNPEFYIYRPRGFKELFPWDFIDTGITKAFLWGEYARSLS